MIQWLHLKYRRRGSDTQTAVLAVTGESHPKAEALERARMKD